MYLQALTDLEGVAGGEWNALVGDYPFLRHEFLTALQRHGCVGQGPGWIPYYLVLRERPAGPIAAAAPTFLKLNSFGEFVFDFAWARAYGRRGLRYYPKLVAAAPFTPATGPRLLVAPGHDHAATGAALAAAVREHAAELGLSSLHWLFPHASDRDVLAADGLLVRDDIQYHWANDGYRDFDDFLATFTSHKRKKIRRERRRVAEQGITLTCLHGDEMDARQWTLAHHFYHVTFERKWNIPVLTREFFAEIGATMGRQVVVVFAHHDGSEVAAAIMLRSDEALYGRYWGCDGDFHSLHFEACYYQGIDYAIAHRLARFEPGAQGEHKIARGFLPRWTHSVHWIAEPAFRTAIADQIERERTVRRMEYDALRRLSPFRAEPAG